MELSKGTHIYGIWFCSSGKSDFLGTLFKGPDNRWTFDYRFRYYKDDKAFDSKDEKHHYSAIMQPGDEHKQTALDAVQEVMRGIEAFMGSPADFILLDCDGADPKVMFELGSREWCHLKIPGQQQVN